MSKKSVYGLGQQFLQGASVIAIAAALAACGTPEPPASSSSSSANSSSSSSANSSSANSSSSSSSSNGSGGTYNVPADPSPNGQWRVNSQGRITDDGSDFTVQCGAWFGLEGQHEPKDAESNPDGAPLELYIGNMWWVESGRTIEQTMDEIKELGINLIRLPIVPQTLESDNEQGMTRVWDGNSTKDPDGRLKNTADAYDYDNAREAMEDFIKIADSKDIKVLVDIHSCSNYVGWRAGKLNSNPPYVDKDREDYDFTREEYSCGGGATNDHPYNETKWLADLREIASLPQKLGVDNMIGIDIFNEPWDYTWDQWATLAEKAYKAIDGVNEDLLIVVEGVGSGLYDKTEVEHGVEESNPNWGENFYSFADRPLQIPRERVVISPHTYGPSVFMQGQFMSGSCADLEGDEAGEAKCQASLDASKLEAGWEEHFGYLRDANYAFIIGEFGGNMDWPNKGTSQANRDLWGHIDGSPDEDWQNMFVDYMIKKDIEGCYWSINPESGDTGGIYTHEYDPVSAEDAWGQWGEFDTRKTALLKRLWSGN